MTMDHGACNIDVGCSINIQRTDGEYAGVSSGDIIIIRAERAVSPLVAAIPVPFLARLLYLSFSLLFLYSTTTFRLAFPRLRASSALVYSLSVSSYDLALPVQSSSTVSS